MVGLSLARASSPRFPRFSVRSLEPRDIKSREAEVLVFVAFESAGFVLGGISEWWVNDPEGIRVYIAVCSCFANDLRRLPLCFDHFVKKAFVCFVLIISIPFGPCYYLKRDNAKSSTGSVAITD